MLPQLPIASMMTFVRAYWQADFFGKLIFLALFALSIICWFFLIHKVYLIHQVRKCSREFQSSIESQKDAILSLALESLPKVKNREIPHPFAHIYLTLKEKTVELLDKNVFFAQKNLDQKNYLSRTDMELVDSHLQSISSKQRANLEKNFFILSTTVTLAPFLGLLGTVWGILITFSELQKGGFMGSNAAVLGGLSTALTTTVLGLLIAIPALIAYNYLKNASRHYFSEMHDFSHLLLSTIELQYRKVDLN